MHVFHKQKLCFFYCDGVFIVIFCQTMYNKTIIRMVFAISRIIKVDLSVNQPWSSPQLECLVIEITRPHSRPFFVSTWYRPPSSSQDIFSRFEILVDKIDWENDDFYLLGDLNCDMLHNRSNYHISSNLTNIFDIYGLSQMISEPTRITLFYKQDFFMR